jgi:hypothetical protein
MNRDDTAMFECANLIQHQPVARKGSCKFGSAAWKGLASGLVLWCGLLSAGAATPRCPGPKVQWQRLAEDVAWVPGAPGESSSENAGQTSALLAARDAQGRVWLVGSGPTPVWARAARCALKTQFGWSVGQGLDPWARPELVLGNRGWAGTRWWALDAVASTMQIRCNHCAERLRQRLGSRGADLPVSSPLIPSHRLFGDSGTWGPWRWWRLERAPGEVVTVLRWSDRPWWVAHGLLWGDGPPDLRDAKLTSMQASTQRLLGWAQGDGAAARWFPEQGPALPAGAAWAHLAYWSALLSAVDQRQQAGALETDLPPALSTTSGSEDFPELPDLVVSQASRIPARMDAGPRAGLNWQRAWREREALSFDKLATPGR